MPASSLPETAPAVLHIDIDAVVANYRQVRSLVGQTRCAAVVKADAYGLGASHILPRLQAVGCADFFVAHLDEALALHPLVGPESRIYVLNGLIPGTELVARAKGIVPVLNSLPQCRRWAKAGGGRSALQVDTGMSRLGLSVEEQIALLADETLLDAIAPALLMSHLANADLPEHPSNAMQLAAFHQARERFPGIACSLANSGGIFLGPDYHFDLCRPGAALYGIAASPLQKGIRQVVQLEVRVAQIRSIEPGVSVGYGFRFTAEKRTRIATLSVGYADGWLRSQSGRGSAWLGTTRLPILGTISMDSLAVDITALAEDALVEGDLVTLVGPHQTINDVALDAGTIGYEILTSLGRRYARVYGTVAESVS